VADPPDIGAYQNASYLTGTMSTTTLSGNIAVTADLLIPSNITFTILPETHIKVENGANIQISGTLNCPYNDEPGDIIIDTILSNNLVGSIIFNSSSSSVLQHATLKHGIGIQCLNGANVDIKYSTLDTGSNGIYIYNSAPAILSNKIIDPAGNGIYGQAYLHSPSIKENILSKLTNQYNASGIYLTNGSIPTITSNDINGFDNGAYLGGGSTAYFFNITHYFHYATPMINNRFTNNNIGIFADSTSTIYAGGGFYNIYGGHNSIFGNNNWNAEALSGSHIYADDNYWGGGSQNNYSDGSSSIEISDTLSDNPWDLFESEKSNNGRNTTNQLKILTDDISEGLLLEQNGQVDEAISYYKDLISRDRHVQFSLSELLHIYIMYSRNEILTYFNGFLSNNRYYYQVKKLLADFHIRNNEFSSGISAYNEIINNNPSTPEVINAKFEKLFAYLNIEKDKSIASQLLSELKALGEDGKEYKERIKIAEFLLAANSGLTKKVNNGKTISAVTSYSVSQNYPNPFNPSTTIRYQIPKPGLVTLKVYDILGKEVATLVNENKIEGSYDFTFNASRFASGVYIYQIRVNDYVSSKKMILLK
jgi:hypothetical protein